MTMGKLVNWRTIVTAFTVGAIVYAIRTGQPSGRFLTVPYDFRMPTLERVRRRWWNPEDSRVFTPHVFGVGWSLNLYQILRLLRSSGDGGAAEEYEGHAEV